MRCFKTLEMATILVVLVTCSLGRTVATPAADRPNIIFIMGDDHTSQAWG